MARAKLSDLVADQIKELIENQEYNSERFLPSEGDMAIKFSVSRATIRESVKMLEVRGFVKRIHGKGIQVTDNTYEVLTRSIGDMISQEEHILDDLLEIRRTIEPKCAQLAALRRDEDDLNSLKEYIEVMENSKSMDDAYYKADLKFHIDLAKASKNRIYASIIAAYTVNLEELIAISSKAETPIEQMHHFHRNIYEAVAHGDAKTAYEAMHKHLQATYEYKEKPKK